MAERARPTGLADDGGGRLARQPVHAVAAEFEKIVEPRPGLGAKLRLGNAHRVEAQRLRPRPAWS